MEDWIMAAPATDSAREPVGTRRVASLLAEFHRLEPGAREGAVLALKALDRGAVIRELSHLINDRDPESRCVAVEALLRVDAGQAIDLVLPLLADPISTVRWNTCGLLHDFGDRRAIPSLVSVLLNDPEADVRLIAAYALGEVGDRSALPALRQVSESDDGTDHEGRRVRDLAAEAIESISARES
jgi:HEAT repeat protein